MGKSHDLKAHPVSTADTNTRSPKRRKTSNPQSGTRSHAHVQRQTNRVRETSRGKRPGPRPPRDLRRPIGQTKHASGLSTPQGASKGDPKFSLPFAKSVLDKIWIRNKNQHRTQPWWKSLSMLRKAVSRLVHVEQEERSLRDRPLGQGGAAVDSKAVRERFEREAQLRGEKEIWADWTRQVLVPKAHLGFSGLVSDTQFAHLGLVLVGLLADVVRSVGLPTPSQQEEAEQARRAGITATTGRGQPGAAEFAMAQSKARSLTDKSTRVTGLQSGEIVERTSDSDDLGEVVERKRSGEDVARKDKTVEATRAPKPEIYPSSTAERPTAPLPSAASIATSQRDSATTAPPTQDRGGGALPPDDPPPRSPHLHHPPASPPDLAAAGTTTTTTTTTTSDVPKDKQEQSTDTAAVAGAGAGKQEQARTKSKSINKSDPKRGGTTIKAKGKGKGKGKGKNAIDDLFAGLT